MPDFRRILIIKPSSLGDIVHALPTLSALRSRFPQAHIAWLVKEQWADILRRAAGLDRVWTVGSGARGWLSEIPAIRRFGFDVAVDLQGLFRSGIMAWLSGSPTRIGFANSREGSSWFYTERIPVSSQTMHAVDRYLLVASAMGAGGQSPPRFDFRWRPEDQQVVEQLLSSHGISGSVPWIAMSVSARWPTKRWPPHFFAETADQLQREGAGLIVFIGGSAEREEVEAVKRLMETKGVDLTGLTSVGLLPALLRSAAVLVTNDTGPMHIAAAVGTPVVAMFGPTSPSRTGPYGSGHTVLNREIPCSPCFSRACRNAVHLECMRMITPAQVLSAVRARLVVRSGRRLS